MVGSVGAVSKSIFQRYFADLAVGLSCDNLIGVDVVLADGSFVMASEQDNEDLFWAVRGAGANFGIVTGLTNSCWIERVRTSVQAS